MSSVTKKEVKSEVLPDGFETKDLVDLSWKGLKKVFQDLEGRPLTKDDLSQYKLALGFINSTNNSVKTSMQFYKLSSLPEAVAMLKSKLQK